MQQFIRLHGAQVFINTACIIKRISLLQRCCSLKKWDLWTVLFLALISPPAPFFFYNILSLFLFLLLHLAALHFTCFLFLSQIYIFQLTSVVLKQTLCMLLYRCKMENWSKAENMHRALFSVNLCTIALNSWYVLVGSCRLICVCGCQSKVMAHNYQNFSVKLYPGD